MIAEFFEQVLIAQSSPTERPDVQAHARAIQESIPHVSRQITQGGLAYPYPGKGVSGESTN